MGDIHKLHNLHTYMYIHTEVCLLCKSSAISGQIKERTLPALVMLLHKCLAIYVQLPVGAPAPTFSKVNGCEHSRRTAARPLSLLAREESQPGSPGLILDSLVSHLFLLSHLLRYQEGPDVQHDVLHVQLGSQSILQGRAPHSSSRAFRTASRPLANHT